MKQKKVKETSNSDLLSVLEKGKNHHTLTRVNFFRSLVLTKFFFSFSKWKFRANHLEIISYPSFLGCRWKSSHLLYATIFKCVFVFYPMSPWHTLYSTRDQKQTCIHQVSAHCFRNSKDVFFYVKQLAANLQQSVSELLLISSLIHLCNIGPQNSLLGLSSWWPPSYLLRIHCIVNSFFLI